VGAVFGRAADAPPGLAAVGGGVRTAEAGVAAALAPPAGGPAQALLGSAHEIPSAIHAN
jgi:hypothetical protein